MPRNARGSPHRGSVILVGVDVLVAFGSGGFGFAVRDIIADC